MNDPLPSAQHAATYGRFAGRAGVLASSLVIGLAFVGFFVGINQGVPQHDDLPPGSDFDPADIPHGDVLPATAYADLRAASIGPTRRWSASLEAIPQPAHDLFAKIEPDAAAKLASLDRRSQTRAFNGAPPVIPHAVDQTSDAACYACHGEGIQIGQRVARPMSHRFLSNCTQCHAPPPPTHVGEPQPVENQFVGARAPLQGQRAWTGAPPTIPHSTWMRENCLACHGSQGWGGMETTHPWRSACLQCHAPSAQLDQAIAAERAPMLPPIPVSGQ